MEHHLLDIMVANYSKLTPVSARVNLEIITGKDGPTVELMPQHYNGLVNTLPQGKDFVLSVFYDLPPDPQKFDPAKTNVDSGRYNVRLKMRQNSQHITLEPDHRHDKGLSRFLSKRSHLEEILTGARRTHVGAIIYEAEY